jgi:hypothetical protein
MRKNYPLFAFVGAIAVQWFLWSRISYIIKDYRNPDSWYFENLGLAGLALLFVAPVLRHGVMWQRVVAGLLCVFPIILLGRYGYYAITELRS